MAANPHLSSLERPFVLGAAALAALFALTGAVVGWIGGGYVAEQARLDDAARAEREASRRAVEDASEAGAELSVLLDGARRAAEMLAREAGRTWTDAPAEPAVRAQFEFLEGTGRVWHRPPGSDVFAVRSADDARDEAALVLWAARLAPVLRAAVGRTSGVSHTAVAFEGLGLVGSPVDWARGAAFEPDVAEDVRRALDSCVVPPAAGWIDTDLGRLLYATPVIRPDGLRTGTAFAEISPETLAQALESAAGRATSVALLSSRGRPLVVTRDFRRTVADEFPGADLGEALRPLVGDGGVFYPGREGHHAESGALRYAAVGLPGLPFSTVVAAPRTEATGIGGSAGDAGGRLGSAMVALSVLFGGTTLLAAWYVARSQWARMRPVLDVIEAHERGRYTETVEVRGEDELARVGRWINTAGVRLRHARSRSEEIGRRIDGLIEATGDGFLKVGADDRIVEVNARFAEMLGRPVHSLVGHYVEELLLPESLERYRAQLARRREGRAARFELAWSAARPPHPRTIVSGIPLFDEDGRYCGAYVTVTDLTEKVRAQEEISRAEKHRALAEMAGGVAHDFNNVLTVVLGNTQYLMLEDLGDEARDTLRTIERAALDGTETVRRIREFSSARAAPASGSVVNPNTVVEDVLADARRRFEAEGEGRAASYKVVIGRKSRRRVRGDAAELKEALANIVENAFEAMPEGGRLSVELFDRGEDAVAIRVEDTGVGMDPEAAKKVFDPFYSTKPAGRCAGLGLSIAFGIVRAHRGRIDVRSQPGEGSSFTIVLPAAAEEPLPEAESPDGRPAEPRVLLVLAGTPESGRIFTELRALGVQAASVRPASAHALVSDPGIFNTLVVDHDLNSVSGWEIARQARAAREDLRIVLLTTPEQPVSETQARNAGIDRVLVRPFDARDLHAEVFALLAAPRERTQAPEPASVRRGATSATSRIGGSGDEPVRLKEIWSGGGVRPSEEPMTGEISTDLETLRAELAEAARTAAAESPGNAPAGE